MMTTGGISYIILAGKKEEITALRIPDNMHHEILRWIHGLPQSVDHFLMGSSYYEAALNTGSALGLDVTWLFEDSYSEIATEKFRQRFPGLKIFVIAVSESSDIDIVNSALGKVVNDGKSVAFCIGSSIKSNIPTADSRDALIDIIDAYTLTCFKDLYAQKRNPHPISNSFDNGMLFNPTVPNTEILHSAVGNFKFEVRKYSDLEKSEESSTAIEKWNTSERQNRLISQLKDFDRLENEFLISNKFVSWMEDQLRAPLILSIPYNSKDILNSLSHEVEPAFKVIQKSIKLAMSAGQTPNYTHLPKNLANISNKDVIGGLLAVTLPRSRYLDILGGLHASICFSPLLRLPAMGSDFNKLLSRVAPVASERIIRPPKKQSLIKTINEIGRYMSDKELSEEARDYIRRGTRQVIAVTDLPIEWMIIDGVPLGFSHDVCRIPEVPYAIGMQHYVIDRNFRFSIPKDILKKTLVVFGCSDSNFLPYQKIAEKESAIFGYKTCRPTNIKELAKEIAEFKPLLMIFDTHGNYDRKTHESYIRIGEDELYPEKVHSYHISAPLIFLSACNTAPVYNLTKTVVNAFIAEGAVAVTAAYMPLSIREASVTYIRLLRLLHVASKRCIHKNWLSFVSYLLRTSVIFEAFFNHKDLNDLTERILQTQGELALESVTYGNRHELYDKLKRGVTADGKKFSFENHVPNYLMYSTIGRADLIDFEVCKEKLSDFFASK